MEAPSVLNSPCEDGHRAEELSSPEGRDAAPVSPVSLPCAQQLVVYHRVPPSLHGDTLFPLNAMSDAQLPSSIKDAAARKYSWRSDLMAGVIPVLDCLWNDVLHTCPIHPSLIFKAQQAAGLSPSPHDRFFVIPISAVSSQPSVVFMYTNVKNEQAFCLKETPTARGILFLNDHSDKVYDFKDFQMPAGPNDYFADQTQFLPFGEEVLQKLVLAGMPAATTNYYQECAQRGGIPLTFFHIPHVLIRGSICIQGLETVCWSD